MGKLAIVAFVLAMLVPAVATAAEDPLADAVRKMRECTEVSDAASRVACYDAAVPAFFNAVNAKPAATPKPAKTATGCKIEDWSFENIPSLGKIKIEGTTTCFTGRIVLRAYDAKNNFLGHDDAYIDANTFTLYINGQSNELNVRYVIR